MKRKRLIRETYSEAEATPGDLHSKRFCNDLCRFFLGESATIPGMSLCSNPNYIKIRETCLSAIGVECDYYAVDDSDLTDIRHISFDYTGQEKRRFPREFSYNSALIRVFRKDEIEEYPTIILDISSEGIGCITPVIIESFPQEFFLIKTSSLGSVIKLICITRRVIQHSSVTEVGASFQEQINKEVLALLLRTG